MGAVIENCLALKLRWKFWELCFHPCALVPDGSRAAPFLLGEAQVCPVKHPRGFQGSDGTYLAPRQILSLFRHLDAFVHL